ncbi:hypothetical protein AX774_g5052 [Zancudomyces culisetae]|uniref:MATH domain-containing protein n=1 Tax=Zancudomyces culisetae TaxID=1213189 RepID=A0A1R1PKN6_ZANCU|nr:hypothetical protein AX774_g5052 [Zancudomyces culisetae]|eukprot:OMH81499.1 hypothetical protein AX774_g5052 [Zancudomyces culisetae]
MNTNAISNNGNPNFNDISEMQKYLDRLRQLTEVRRMAELEQRAAQDVLQSGYGGPSSGVNDLMPSAVYGGQAGFGLKNNPGLGPPREMYEQQRMMMDGQGHTATFGMGSSGGGGSGSAGSGSGSVSGGGIGSGHPLDQGLGLATADSKIGYKNTEQTGYVTKNEFRNLQGSVNQLVEMMTAQLMLQSTSPQQAHSRGGGIPLHSVAGGGGGFDPYLSAIGNQSNYLASLMAKKQHSTMRNNMNANSPSINGINSMFSAYPSIQPGFSPNLAQQIPGIPNPYLAQQQQQQLQQQQQQQQLAQNIITVRSRPATANPDIKPSPNEQQAVTDDSKNSNNGDERVSIFDENAYANAYMENLVSEFKAFHWKIQNWDQLEKRVTSDTFECGGHTW